MKKIKVELHTHTNYSYDSDLSFEQIINKCKKEKIDVLGIADHNEIEGAMRLSKIAPFKVIVGQEVLTSEGEVIGFFIKSYITPGMTMDKTIEEIKSQDGIAYLPHPFDKVTRKTAVKEELINTQLLQKIDVIEVHNGRTIYNNDNKKANRLAEKYKKNKAVGSDAHTIHEFGRNYLVMDDFSDAGSFLNNLKKAQIKKGRVMPWVFLITKFVRFKKRNYKTNYVVDKNNACDLCGSKKYNVIYQKKGKAKVKYFISDDSYGVHHQIVRCADCRLIYCHPREKDNLILKRYKNFVDELYEKEREARQENQKNILNNLLRLNINKGKILDVGAATGSFVEVANKNGWDAYGIEPSIWAVNYAKENYGVNIAQGTLENVNLKKRSFDVITLIDVIEHVTSPRELLLNVKSLLKDDGVVVIVTPDIKSLMANIMGEKWWHIRPDHVFYFDFLSLKLLIESVGFEVVYKKPAGWNFSYNYWISRFKNMSKYIYKFFSYVENISMFNFLTKRNYHINFGDSIELYIKKRK